MRYYGRFTFVLSPGAPFCYRSNPSIGESIMTLDRSYFPSKGIAGQSRFLDELLQEKERALEKKPGFKMVAPDDMQRPAMADLLVRAEPPPGVDQRDIDTAAIPDGAGAAETRRKLAIQVLQAASNMNDDQQRKDEIHKLKLLFQFGKTPEDIEIRTRLRPLTDKEVPTNDDCLAAVMSFDKLEERRKLAIQALQTA